MSFTVSSKSWVGFAVVFAALLMCLVLPAAATTYYVNGAAGDDLYNDGTSPSQAWATISRADQDLFGNPGPIGPGDVVEVMGGEYMIPDDGGNFTLCSGAANNPITYRANGSVKLITSYTPAFNFASTLHDIVIDGFEITGNAASGIKLNGADRITIQNCHIHDMAQLAMYVDMDSGGCDNCVVRNNLFTHASTDPSYTYMAVSAEGPCFGLLVANNTVVRARNGFLFAGQTELASVTIVNNILTGCLRGMYIGDADNKEIYSYNCLYANTYDYYPPGVVGDISDIYADPKFIGGTPFDYHLQATSPAIDAGTDVGIPFNGNAPDMGRFETNYTGGTVAGKVSSALTDSPLAYATVEIVGSGKSAITDATGSYSFGALIPGDYTVKATFGRVSSQINVTVYEAQVTTQDFSLTPETKTFYVKTDGDNEKDGESLANAWATIDNGDAKGLIMPGDTIEVQAGTYSSNVVLTKGFGTTGYPVTYKVNGAVKIDTTAVSMFSISDTMHDIVIDGFEITGTGAVDAQSGIKLNGADNITVQNCYIHDLCNAGMTAYIDLMTPGTSGCTIRNNVFAYAGADAPSFAFIEDWGGITGLKILNNVFDKARYGIYIYSNPDPVAITNNILVNCTRALADDGGGSVVNNSHNLYFGNTNDYWSFAVKGAKEFTADPMFIGGGNYHLQQGSPAIDEGADVGIAFLGTAPDLGAFESAYVRAPITYFVKPGGNDNADGKSLANAWATIVNGDAKGVLKAGDIIEVQAGAYNQSVNLISSAGAPGYPVIYKANGSVKIDSTSASIFNIADQLHDITIDGFELTGTGAVDAQSGIKLNGADNITIQNCYIHDLSNAGMTAYIDLMTAGTSGCTIQKNLLVYSGTDAPMYTSISDWGGITGLNIYNNTISRARYGIYIYANPDPVKIINNILVNNTRALTDDGGGTVLVNANNLYYANENDYWSFALPGAYETNADPMFVSSTDYHLSEGSPAVDAGVDVGLASQGMAPDLGAFESPYVGGTEYADLGEVKTLAVGSAIIVNTTKIVTVGANTFSDGCFYIEESTRSCGIKVKPEVTGLPSVVPGNAVTFTGIVRVDANGEKYIGIKSLTKGTGTEVKALGMTNKDLASNVGPGSTALLVRVWGNITYKDSDYIYVDDGTNYDDGQGLGLGVRVMISAVTPAITKTFTEGAFVAGITGIATYDAGVICVRPRSNADIDL